MRKYLVLAFSLMASSAFAGQSKVAVCHYSPDADTWNVINVGGQAAQAHLTNHGDVVPGSYYPDLDGDGYGDAAGATSVCPATGYVTQAGDCDDDTSGVSPAASESCGDSVDNDCDGLADEDCNVSCPCDYDPYWAVALSGVPIEGSWFVTANAIQAEYNYGLQASMLVENYEGGGYCQAFEYDGSNLVIGYPQSTGEGLACRAEVLNWICSNYPMESFCQ